MHMWALRRRIFTVAVIFGIFFLFFGLPYLWSQREIPSCFDKKQNDPGGIEETGVDCGGPCALVCKGAAKPLSVIWQKIFPVREGVYDVVAYVENPNFGMGIPRLSYTARLFDASGAVIAEKISATHVGSNERFVVFAGGLFTGDKKPSKGSIEFTKEVDWIVTDVQESLFEVGEKTLTSPSTKPRLSAVLRSKSTQTLRDIDVSAIVYDEKNTSIGVSETKVTKLDPGGEEKLFFTWNAPFVYSAATEACEVPVDVVLALDRSGSMRSDRRDPPEPLTTAKDAAADFVDRMSKKDQIGYISFATDISRPFDQTLTDRADKVKAAILRTVIGSDGLQFTNIAEAIAAAGKELTSIRHNDDAESIIVLLTDGVPTRPESNDDPDYPSKAALQMAEEAKKAGITIFTIGLGIDLNPKLLEEIATDPAHYYASPTAADLSRVYQDISTAICKKNPSIIEIIPRVDPFTLGAN